MRVLTVGNLYPPHHFGGYELVWQSAVQHLRGRGHEVRVLAVDYRHHGVEDGPEPGVHRALRWYWQDHEFVRLSLRDRVAIERHNHGVLQAHLDELRPQVVSFWSMGGMSHSLIEAVRRRQLPMVAFVHDQWFDYGRFTDQWLRLFWRRSAWPAKVLAQRVFGVPTWIDYGSAGRYVFVSEFVRQRALGLPLGLVDTAVAPSGIDPLFIQPPHDLSWQWRLLCVGRLHPDKGIHQALSALQELPAEATLTYAGSWDPREERTLRRQVEQTGLSARVRFLGQLSAAELARVYREHDALLFPALWDEPWGLVPLEAMGSGCLVIASGRGGSAEYLRDGHNCLLVPGAEPGSLAASVHRLASEPQLRRQLRAGGTRTAQRHTREVFNAQVEEHLLAVTSVASRS